jgi:hypothetical protein
MAWLLPYTKPLFKSTHFDFMLYESSVDNFGIIVVTVIPAVRIEIVQHKKIIYSLKHINYRK